MGPTTAKGKRRYAQVMTLITAYGFYYFDGNWDRFMGAVAAVVAMGIVLFLLEPETE